MLTHKEITVPLSDYKILYGMKAICLLVDPQCKFAKSTGLDTSVKMSVYADDDYYSEDRNESKQLGEAFFDVVYSRDTRLENILPSEWNLMYGHTTLKEFIHHNPKVQRTSPVKLFCLQRLNYDLRDLNNSYRNPTKFGR